MRCNGLGTVVCGLCVNNHINTCNKWQTPWLKEQKNVMCDREKTNAYHKEYDLGFFTCICVRVIRLTIRSQPSSVSIKIVNKNEKNKCTNNFSKLKIGYIK